MQVILFAGGGAAHPPNPPAFVKAIHAGNCSSLYIMSGPSMMFHHVSSFLVIFQQCISISVHHHNAFSTAAIIVHP